MPTGIERPPGALAAVIVFGNGERRRGYVWGFEFDALTNTHWGLGTLGAQASVRVMWRAEGSPQEWNLADKRASAVWEKAHKGEETNVAITDR